MDSITIIFELPQPNIGQPSFLVMPPLIVAQNTSTTQIVLTNLKDWVLPDIQSTERGKSRQTDSAGIWARVTPQSPHATTWPLTEVTEKIIR